MLSGVALVPGRVRNTLPLMEEIREQFESAMTREDFLANAPFAWIGLVLRYGHENADAPHIHSINEDYGDLPVAIEVDMKQLHGATKEDVRQHFIAAMQRTLSAVGLQYSLPVDRLEQAVRGIYPGGVLRACSCHASAALRNSNKHAGLAVHAASSHPRPASLGRVAPGGSATCATSHRCQSLPVRRWSLQRQQGRSP